jgi:hypothetical protein
MIEGLGSQCDVTSLKGSNSFKYLYRHERFEDEKSESTFLTTASRVPEEHSFWKFCRFRPFVLLVSARRADKDEYGVLVELYC